MARTASLADQLAALQAPDGDANPESLATAVVQAEQYLDDLHQAFAQRATELQATRTYQE